MQSSKAESQWTSELYLSQNNQRDQYQPSQLNFNTSSVNSQLNNYNDIIQEIQSLQNNLQNYQNIDENLAIQQIQHFGLDLDIIDQNDQVQITHVNKVQKLKNHLVKYKKKRNLVSQVAQELFQHFKNTSLNQIIQIQNPQQENQNKKQKLQCTNLYLTLKSLYLKSFDNMTIAINKSQTQDKIIQSLKDQQVLISMRDIHIQHNDFDFWQRQSLMSMYTIKNIESNKNNNLGQSKIQQGNQENQGQQDDNLIERFKNGSKSKNSMIEVKQEHINKDLQSFLLGHSQKGNAFNVNNYLLASLTFAQKIKRSFCLYNRTKNQQRLYTTTHYEFNNQQLGRHYKQGQQEEQNQRQISQSNQNEKPGQLFQNQNYEKIYLQKLQCCKQVAHSYVFSGYGYRRFLSHGFQMSMYKYRSYLTSMLRVVFRQLQKFVFQSQTYKKKHNINQLAEDQYIYHPPEDRIADNPRQRVPYRQFQCIVRPLYHFHKHFSKAVTQTWNNIFKITFSIGDQRNEQGQEIISLQDKPQQKMTEQQIVVCYQAVRQQIKQIVNDRIDHDMKRFGLTNKIKNKKRKTKLEQGYQDQSHFYQNQDEQDQDQTTGLHNYGKKNNKKRF